MKTYKQFITESEDSIMQLDEATKAQVIEFMAKSEWTKHDTYLFGLQAKAAGLFKSDLAAAKAFSKYYEDYLKVPHGNAPRPIFKNGKVVMSGGPAKKAGPKPIKLTGDKMMDNLAYAASWELEISKGM